MITSWLFHISHVEILLTVIRVDKIFVIKILTNLETIKTVKITQNFWSDFADVLPIMILY